MFSTILAIFKFTLFLTLVLVVIWLVVLIPLGVLTLSSKKDKSHILKNWAKFALKNILIVWIVLIAMILLVFAGAFVFGQFFLKY